MMIVSKIIVALCYPPPPYGETIELLWPVIRLSAVFVVFSTSFLIENSSCFCNSIFSSFAEKM